MAMASWNLAEAFMLAVMVFMKVRQGWKISKRVENRSRA
jgi:hypothetical protein